jgi:erythromycin esterase-like protein
MEAVVAYLDEVDPEAAQRARERYACFDQFGRDPQVYAYEAGIADAEPCEPQVVEQLLEVRNMAAEAARRNGQIDEDRHFYAEQNAHLVANAERYYRAMFRGGIESWNLRDSHMAETLEALVGHLERGHPGGHAPVKAVVWAHNSHLGDARATELGQVGELNLGQLVRERYGREALLVGFSTYTGMVTAASDWGGPAERKHVRPAVGGSWEELFHELAVPDLLLGTGGLEGRRLERAIGVVYRRRPSGSRITSTLAWPASSTPFSTSTRRAPSSRWSARANGRSASYPRPIPGASKAACSRDHRTPHDACQARRRHSRRRRRPCGP